MDAQGDRSLSTQTHEAWLHQRSAQSRHAQGDARWAKGLLKDFSVAPSVLQGERKSIRREAGAQQLSRARGLPGLDQDERLWDAAAFGGIGRGAHGIGLDGTIRVKQTHAMCLKRGQAVGPGSEHSDGASGRGQARGEEAGERAGADDQYGGVCGHGRFWSSKQDLQNEGSVNSRQ